LKLGKTERACQGEHQQAGSLLYTEAGASHPS
jgi:hypothetical protein